MKLKSPPREPGAAEGVQDWSDHLKMNLNLTIIGPTRTLKIQGFGYKWQDFWSDQGRSGRTGSAGLVNTILDLANRSGS